MRCTVIPKQRCKANRKFRAVGGNGLHGTVGATTMDHHQQPPEEELGLFHGKPMLLKLVKYFEGIVNFYPLESWWKSIISLTHSSGASPLNVAGTRRPTCGCPALLVHLILHSHGQPAGESPHFCKVCATSLTTGSEHLLQITLEGGHGLCVPTQRVCSLDSPGYLNASLWMRRPPREQTMQRDEMQTRPSESPHQRF